MLRRQTLGRLAPLRLIIGLTSVLGIAHAAPPGRESRPRPNPAPSASTAAQPIAPTPPALAPTGSTPVVPAAPPSAPADDPWAPSATFAKPRSAASPASTTASTASAAASASTATAPEGEASEATDKPGKRRGVLKKDGQAVEGGRERPSQERDETEKDGKEKDGKEKDDKLKRPLIAFKKGAGFTLATEDGDFSWFFRSRVQLRETYQAFPGDPTGGVVQVTGFPSSVEARRRNNFSIQQFRLAFGGNMFGPKTFFYGQIAFGVNDDEGSPIPLLDAYVDFRQLRDLNVQIGTIDHRYAVFTSASNQLIERGMLVAETSIRRELGILFHSDKLFGVEGLRYWLEVANGESLELADGYKLPVGFLYFGRVQVQPLGAFESNHLGDLERSRRPKLAVGATAAYNQNSFYELSNRGNRLTVPFDYTHGFADLHFKWRGFSLFTELAYRRALQRYQQGANGVEFSRNAWAVSTQVGMMLTSKLEVATRGGLLYKIAESPMLNDMREVAAGASYYLNGHAFKVQAEYVRIFREDFLDGGLHQPSVMLSYQP